MPATVQSLDLLIPDVATTTRLAADLADRLRGGEVILLEGDLGAGKTTFVRGVVAQLGDCEASSPSFTIENIYPTPSWTIHHYDFHRLVDLGIEGLVLQEALADPRRVVIIEWPEIVRPLLPPTHLTLEFQFQPQPEARRLVYRASPGLSYLLPPGGLASGSAD